MSSIFTVHRQPYGEVMNPISADGVRFHDKNGDITEVRMVDGMVNIHVGGVTVSAEHLEDLVRQMFGRGEHPPAEAQAQGGGEVELRHMVAKLAAHVRPTCGELWAEAERLLNHTAPPSAPVGVEGLDAAADAGYITFESMKQCADAWFAVVDALNAAAPGWNEKKGAGRECATAAIAALAQQPAAAGEEIMVNAAHDVYTLPLQPSGLSSGPRFVVHVPGAEQPAVCAHSWHDYGTVPRAWCSRCNAVAVAGHEDRPYGVLSVSDDGKYRTDPIQQPAAVDEAMVERAARAWCAGTDTPFDQLPDTGKAWCLEDMRVVLTAAVKGLLTCYQCGKTVTWLAPDSRCGDCTRLTPDEVRG